MLIDFYAKQITQFLHVAERLINTQDLALDSVADFYAVPWLLDFPHGSTWHVTGLDDGAEQFYAVVEFRGYRLLFTVAETVRLELQLPPPPSSSV